ncbi:acyl carrier protein [Alkalimarinus alittae]|uniref:Phosphopantetheine-binding protein n=1 Tax=Alkalimarinus alittae TaxID=2961619 RepID=A0ABY6N645_9ALTE|nr:phosphopantetheine-binding protein [Alkalimarinus alittae]UZE97561.1 phosphopantetheine-binding protein [Alkalimarinus alittae]
MSNVVRDFIVSLLEKKQAIPAVLDINDYRFMESGHIDSLAVMKFILQIEDKFDIEISDEDMLSQQFQTVGGLSAIVNEKIGLK